MENEKMGQQVQEETSSALEAAPAAEEFGALDELENVDFLLEEIENKIAPLALA